MTITRAFSHPGFREPLLFSDLLACLGWNTFTALSHLHSVSLKGILGGLPAGGRLPWETVSEPSAETRVAETRGQAGRHQASSWGSNPPLDHSAAGVTSRPVTPAPTSPLGIKSSGQRWAFLWGGSQGLKVSLSWQKGGVQEGHAALSQPAKPYLLSCLGSLGDSPTHGASSDERLDRLCGEHGSLACAGEVHPSFAIPTIFKVNCWVALRTPPGPHGGMAC